MASCDSDSEFNDVFQESYFDVLDEENYCDDLDQDHKEDTTANVENQDPRAKRRDLSFLDVHISISTNGEGKKVFTCRVCDKVFKTKHGCKTHIMKGHNIQDTDSEETRDKPKTSTKKKNTVKIRPKYKYSKEDAIEDSILLFEKSLLNVLEKPLMKTGRKIPGVASVVQLVEKLQGAVQQSPGRVKVKMGQLISILWPAVSAGDGVSIGCTHREAIYSKYHEIRVSGEIYRGMVGLCSEFGINVMKRDSAVITNVMFETLVVYREKYEVNREAKNGSTPVLDEVAENILRYACGYIPMALARRMSRYGSSFLPLVECLNAMKNSTGVEASSFLSYTTEWIQKENRGGLYTVRDKVYLFFRRVEMLFRQEFSVSFNNIRERVLDAVLADRVGLCHWGDIASGLSEEQSVVLLTMCVKLWVNIRGHSSAKTIIQHHKLKAGKGSSKSLRKDLKSKTSY